MTIRIMTVAIRQEQDVVAARQRARQIAAQLGFGAQDQARISTAVSEIARNAFRYAGGGEVDFAVEGDRAPQVLSIQVRDAGKGIADLEAILSGRYRSVTGMGLGITGARRLMDQCAIRSTPRGTSVLMKKVLPDEAALIDAETVARRTRSSSCRSCTSCRVARQPDRTSAAPTRSGLPPWFMGPPLHGYTARCWAPGR